MIDFFLIICFFFIRNLNFLHKKNIIFFCSTRKKIDLISLKKKGWKMISHKY